ncbi:unnamed protein product [Citrullus colocynthis]|uniref:Uncharacterized protein n=1 Tax=Citrullus colocynthis TaxID=252529 RepID=A0ABP0YE11_9ROSI
MRNTWFRVEVASALAFHHRCHSWMAARLSATAAGRQSLAASCRFSSLHHWACRTREATAHLGGAAVAEMPVGMIGRSGTKRGRRFTGVGPEEGEDNERGRDQREEERSARERRIDKRGRDW